MFLEPLQDTAPERRLVGWQLQGRGSLGMQPPAYLLPHLPATGSLGVQWGPASCLCADGRTAEKLYSNVEHSRTWEG